MMWFFSFLMQAFAQTVDIATPYFENLQIQIEGAGKHAVIFVHGQNESSQNFHRLSGLFAKEGMMTITYDLPGSGMRNQQEAIGALMHLEIRAIVQYLHTQGVYDVQCVGSGLGGTLCLQANSPQTGISQVALIAPVLYEEEQYLLGNIDAYPDWPILFLVGSTDMDSQRALQKTSNYRKVIEGYAPGIPSGTKVLSANTALENVLMEWIWRTHPDLPAHPPMAFDNSVPSDAIKTTSLEALPEPKIKWRKASKITDEERRFYESQPQNSENPQKRRKP